MVLKRVLTHRVLHRGLRGGLVAALSGGLAGSAGAQLSPPGVAPTRLGDAGTMLPLTTTRVLRFTTDEGTWISLDVSPDGRTIVFDLLGDLYTLPMTGGPATRITSGPGFDGQPRFSPDGQRIVFTSDREGAENLWLARPDGSQLRRLTRGGGHMYMSPEWTPDGQYIVASRKTQHTLAPFDDHALYLWHVHGGAGLELLNKGQGAAFGPDPRYLWATSTGRFQSTGDYQLFVYDRHTGVRRAQSTLRSHPAGAMRPVLSPDGHWLVYATRRDTTTALRLRDLRTGTERWFVEGIQHDQGEGSDTRDAMPGASFTPDSKALVLSAGGKLWRIAVPSGERTLIPFTAEIEQHLGPLVRFEYPITDSVLTVRQIRHPRLSPDGTRVVFEALDRLWIAELPAGAMSRPGVDTVRGARRLTAMEVSEFEPAWSPDGRAIVYATWSRTAGGAVYRARADGRGRPTRLTTEPGYYTEPNYTPTGSRLVVMKAPRDVHTERTVEDGDLVWLPAGGGATTVILRGAPGRYQGFPGGQWESRYPYVTGRDTSRLFVGPYSVRWDGRDFRAHVNLPGGPAAEVRFGPAGQRAVVTVVIDEFPHVYLVTVPPGREPFDVAVVGASMPVQQLSDMGGQFVDWTPDGRTISFALGNSLFLYDVARADSLRRQATARGLVEADAVRPGPKRLVIALTVPKDRPRGTLVLRGARIVTMQGTEVIGDGDLVVRDNRIVAVGPRGHVPLPAQARVLDLTGKVIMPGLVDIHAHMHPRPVERRTVYGGQPWEYAINLAYGVTTSRDPQNEFDVITDADMVAAGRIVGPRIFTTGPGITDRHRITSLEKARQVLRRYSAEYFDTQTLKVYMPGDRRVRQWLAMAARELRLTPTFEGAQDSKMDLTELLDGTGGQEHNLPVTPLYRDVLQVLAFSGTTYTPTLLANFGAPQAVDYFVTAFNPHDDPKVRRFMPHFLLDEATVRRDEWRRAERYGFRRYAEQLAKLVAAGGRVGFGSHGEFQGLGAHWELWAMQSGGLTPHEVLRAATIVSADAIGLGRELGTLEAGKLADLLVLDNDPLVNIKHTTSIRYVMKNGRLYDGATLDEVWPRARPFVPAGDAGDVGSSLTAHR